MIKLTKLKISGDTVRIMINPDSIVMIEQKPESNSKLQKAKTLIYLASSILIEVIESFDTVSEMLAAHRGE